MTNPGRGGIPDALRKKNRWLSSRLTARFGQGLWLGLSVTEEEIKKLAWEQPRIQEWLQGKEWVKTIVIQRRLVNIVTMLTNLL